MISPTESRIERRSLANRPVFHAFAFDTGDNRNTCAIRVLVFKRGLARQAEVIHLRESATADWKLRISRCFE